jgi:hypothetical protein
MVILPYDTESKSRNADFIFIARKGDTTTLGPKGRCPLSEATQPCTGQRILDTKSQKLDVKKINK